LAFDEEAMKITIENSYESVYLAVALLEFTKDSLKRSGYLVERDNEQNYYTDQRRLLKALERFLENRA
jgi:hypothetical protein